MFTPNDIKKEADNIKYSGILNEVKTLLVEAASKNESKCVVPCRCMEIRNFIYSRLTENGFNVDILNAYSVVVNLSTL